MDDIQKEALFLSRLFLIENIIPDTLWNELLVKGIFTEMMLEPMMMPCKTRTQQVQMLLSDLNRRPKEAYEDFISCLIATGHQHCADEIRKNEYKVREERSSDHDERQVMEYQGVEGIPVPVQETDPDHKNTQVMESALSEGMSAVQESHPAIISGTEDKGCASASQCNDVVADDVAQGNCEELSNITSRSDQSDMIFAIQGHVSYRGGKEGSFFLVEWFWKHYADMIIFIIIIIFSWILKKIFF